MRMRSQGLPTPAPNPGTQVCPLLLCGWQNSNTASQQPHSGGPDTHWQSCGEHPQLLLQPPETLTQQALKASPSTLAPFSNRRQRTLSLAEQHTRRCPNPQPPWSPSCLQGDPGTGATGPLGQGRLPGAASSTGNGFLFRGLSVHCFSHVPSPPAMT